jgi:signal transduction histidine kinase
MADHRRQHVVIAGAALVAGAFEAAHGLAWQGRVFAWPIAYMIVGMFVELEVLTLAFRRGLPHRSAAWAFVLAIALGIAASFAGWLVQRGLDVPLLGGMAAARPAVVVQLGAFDGLVGLGLWAVAILLPSAVQGALEARQLRSAAELARLRANLQPHFLLNTLSTVSGLVTEDPREARELIGALGDLLRDALDRGDETQSLADEVDWLRRYAAIFEIRHRGSVAFQWDISDQALGARIPRLLLQPLLENAVQHGALRRREGGEVAVRATRAGDVVTCVIEDNGPGPSAKTRDGARGLELVTRRLELQYPGAAAFRLEASGGRTRSIVELPA